MLPEKFAHLAAAASPRWLVEARGEFGVAEVAGRGSNPKVLAYRKEAGTPLGGDDSDVPWCAIFVNAMLARAGVATSGSAMARSFAKHPGFEKLAAPILGCIAVKSSNRGPASGHVGFYVAENPLFVWLLGGNQGDAVSIAAFKKKDFVGFFWPKGVAKPKDAGPVKLARPLLPHERRKTREA